MLAFSIVFWMVMCFIHCQKCTTLGKESSVCPVCHTTSTHLIITSTNQFGSPDLDLRPPPMKRSTLPRNVQCCPNCGLCQYNLGKNMMDVSNDVLSSFISSNIFQTENSNLKQLINDNYLPISSSQFHRLALLQQYINASNVDIAQSFLSASWICDDQLDQIGKNDEKYEILETYMIKYRKLAAEYFEKELNDIYNVLRYIDILRRTNVYDECIINSNNAITQISNNKKCDVEDEECGIMLKVVIFQKEKCKIKDNNIYTVKDAMKYVDNKDEL